MSWSCRLFRAFRPAALIVFAALPAVGGQAVGWWGGDWQCNIDGRAALMRWTTVNIDDGECWDEDGATICSSSSSVGWRGRFSDNGSPWVPLTDPRLGSRGGMYFNHADGNRWYLAEPEGGTAYGWTTWNGQRYPLSCWR